MMEELAAALETMRHDFHFPGHLIPGTAFILMGVWWIWNTFKIYNKNEELSNSEYLLSQENLLGKVETRNSTPYRATYDGDLQGIFYCEGFYKTLYAIFDLSCHILVVVTGGDLMNEEQHITVYIFFILNGIIDINRHLKFCKMPNGTDYIASSITWTALGFLFLSHKHAKTTVSIYYHQTFGWMSIAVGLVTLIQYKFDKNTLTALVRGSCCILTGTWLYQIAFSFHNPFIAANQFRNIVREEAIPKLLEREISSCSDTQVTMIEQMEIMHAATLTTWHFIFVGTVVVILGIMVSRSNQHRYYERIRNCCV